MNLFLPALAAILQAGSFVLDKVFLSLRRANFKMYLGVSFPLVFVVTFVAFIVFRPPFVLGFLSGKYGFILLASIILAVVTNILFYRALAADKLGEIQMLEILNKIPVIVFSGLLFADERNFNIIIPAAVASLAVAWSHWEKHHFQMAKYTLPFLAWSLIASPLGASLSKILLTVWHPISLELVRSGVIALFLAPLFLRYIVKTTLKTFLLLVLINVLTSVAWILFYFSYQHSGIVYTTLIFSLQPLLVYFASLFILKEKFEWKKTTAFAVVLISIVISQKIT